jgi:hypothetical protein
MTLHGREPWGDLRFLERFGIPPGRSGSKPARYSSLGRVLPVWSHRSLGGSTLVAGHETLVDHRWLLASVKGTTHQAAASTPPLVITACTF